MTITTLWQWDGARLRDLCERRGLTPSELGRRARIRRQLVWSHMSDDCAPSLALFRRYCLALGPGSARYLLGLDN